MPTNKMHLLKIIEDGKIQTKVVQIPIYNV
jgi:hypothetical protein